VTTTATQSTRSRRNARPAHAPDRRSARPACPDRSCSCCKAAAHSAPIRSACTRPCNEAGIEPDWVIGTSIGAINAALISGNRKEDRLDKLNAFWDRVEQQWADHTGLFELDGPGQPAAQHAYGVAGHSGVLSRRTRWALGGSKVRGRRRGGVVLHSTEPLRETLGSLVDFDYLCECHTRLTVGAVNRMQPAHMRYFDKPQRAHRRRTRDWRPVRFPPAFAGHPDRWRAVLGRRHLTRTTRRSRPCSTTCRGATR